MSPKPRYGRAADDADRRRAALRRFMAAHGLNMSRWAADAGLSDGTLRNFLKGRAESLTQRSLEALAGAAGQPVSAVIGESPLAGTGNVVLVEGAVGAGDWHDRISWPPDQRFAVTLPEIAGWPSVESGIGGWLVRGRDADLRYPPGSILICVPAWRVVAAPASGERVICQRRRTGKAFELTVREFVADDDGRLWLWPRSSLPEYQSPIELARPVAEDPAARPVPVFDDDGAVRHYTPAPASDDDPNLLVIARVVASFCPELADLAD